MKEVLTINCRHCSHGPCKHRHFLFYLLLMEKRKEIILFLGVAAWDRAYHALPFLSPDKHRDLPDGPWSVSTGPAFVIGAIASSLLERH